MGFRAVQRDIQGCGFRDKSYILDRLGFYGLGGRVERLGSGVKAFIGSIHGEYRDQEGISRGS